jgi:hypothetical protein
VSLLYNSSSYAGVGDGRGPEESPDISLQDALQDDREVCHSALWLQGSDVFLYVPYSVFVVVAVRRPSSGAIALGETAEVSTAVDGGWACVVHRMSQSVLSLIAHWQLHVRAVLDDEGEDDELLPVAPWV